MRRPAGVRSVALLVNETLYSENDEPSPWSRVASVGVSLDRSSMDSASALLTRHMGAPKVFCYRRGDEQRVVLYYWPDGDKPGALLAAPEDSTGEVLLTLVTPEPDTLRIAPGRCDAA
jgi:hypothetical protein